MYSQDRKRDTDVDSRVVGMEVAKRVWHKLREWH